MIDLPGADRRDPGGGLLHEDGAHLVDVGQAIVGKLLVEAPVVVDLVPHHHALLDPFDQVERSGADVVAPVLHVAVLLDHLGRVDRPAALEEDVVQRVEPRLGQLEHHGAVVGGGDRLVEAGVCRAQRGRYPLLGELPEPEVPVPVVDDVVRGELAAVGRRPVAPEHVVADGEDHGHVVGHGPALGQLANHHRHRDDVGIEGVHVAVDAPIADGETLVDAIDGVIGVVGVPGVGTRRRPDRRVADRPAVARREQHLAGGRIFHHLARRGGGGLGFLLAAGPRAGRGQTQGHSHGPPDVLHRIASLAAGARGHRPT